MTEKFPEKIHDSYGEIAGLIFLIYSGGKLMFLSIHLWLEVVCQEISVEKNTNWSPLGAKKSNGHTQTDFGVI